MWVLLSFVLGSGGSLYIQYKGKQQGVQGKCKEGYVATERRNSNRTAKAIKIKKHSGKGSGYEGIQMLGHIVATLERFSRMGKTDQTAEPYPRTAD